MSSVQVYHTHTDLTLVTKNGDTTDLLLSIRLATNNRILITAKEFLGLRLPENPETSALT